MKSQTSFLDNPSPSFIGQDDLENINQLMSLHFSWNAIRFKIVFKNRKLFRSCKIMQPAMQGQSDSIHLKTLVFSLLSWLKSSPPASFVYSYLIKNIQSLVSEFIVLSLSFFIYVWYVIIVLDYICKIYKEEILTPFHKKENLLSNKQSNCHFSEKDSRIYSNKIIKENIRI